MSQQIQITGGAKVRGLNGVLTGTSGIVSSVPLGAANGVATLDSGGKVPVSQLPSSVVTYLGTWNAATNTPTLVNGTGDAGDMYICNVAGTVNFGAGPVTFAVGDWVLYGSGTWEKSNGQNGTVTSVAASITGSAIGLTGSPITTAGTLAFAFAGTNLEYVNGAGNLTTFPTLMTSVGLTMPSAFTVTNSPLTGAGGTLAVTGAGTTAQYIRGDGSLATFPTIASEAQRLITEVYNSTGATLTKGTVVYINGGQGNLPTVTKAIATGDATSAQTYGIVQADITNMNNGYVVVVGSLMDLDTQAYAAGTQLYLSSTVAGQWTSVKQYAPAHLVYVGIVVRSHPTQGVVEVRIQNGFELDELHNVSAQTPSNNDGIFYNSTTSLWESKSIAAALGYTPADASLVVPYTGATTDVDLGSYNLFTSGGIQAAQFNAIGYGVFGGYLHLKKGSVPYGVLTGSNSITADGYKIVLMADTGSSPLIGRLDLGSLTATRTYILPDASGTISLTSDLAGYVDLTTAQTIGGTKTFSDATKNNGGIFLQNASSNSLAGYMNIGGLTNGVKFTSGGGISNTFTLPSATGYTFTFPNATGTLALTSDIPSLVGYVPYTGATTNVDLGGNSLYLNNSQAVFGRNLAGSTSYALIGVNASNKVQIDTSALGVVFGGTIGNGTYTYTLPSATGTLALTSDLTGGTVTSVAALTIGTTGTDLSSSVANSTTTPVITLNVPTASATNRGALSSADWTTFNNKQGTITLTTTGTSGAATFSSNTLNIPNYGSALSGYLPLAGGTLTGQLNISFTNISSTFDNSSYLRLVNTGTSTLNQRVDLIMRWQDGTYNGTGGISMVRESATARSGKLVLQPIGSDGNNVEALIINSSGNLGLGVTPSAWASGYKAFQIFTTSLFGTSSRDANLGANVFVNTSGNYAYTESSQATVYTQYQGVHSWYNAPSGTAGNAITFTQAMTLFSTGNLAVGTTTDSGYKLDVNGTGRFTSQVNITNSSALRLTRFATESTYYGDVAYTSGGLILTSVEGYIKIGKGTSSSPTSYLSIVDGGAATFSSSVTAAAGIFNLNTTDGGFKVVGVNATPTTLSYLANNYFPKFYTRNHNYGITIFDQSEATAIQSADLVNGSNARALIFNPYGGNVLIGTTTDSGYKLDVDGTARVTGASFILGTNTLANNNQLSINSASGYAQRIAFKVAGTDQWLIGNGAASQNTNFELYNTNGQMALSFVKSTSAATFYASVTATGFFESSDSRLKTLIQDNYQTKGIASITPKLYTKNGKVELGYYAQDFVGVLDSAVSKGSDDMLSLSYREVHTAKIYALEQEIKELKAKMN